MYDGLNEIFYQLDHLDARRQRYMAESEASRASELGGPGASTLSELIDQVLIK